MDRGELIAGLKLNQIPVGHAVVLDAFSGTEDGKFLRTIIVNDPEMVVLAVELHGNAVEIVIVALIDDLHVAEIAVNGAPDAAEIVSEDAVFPVHVNIVVTAEIEK